MAENDAISNTSPLIYLYRIKALDWLPHLFGEMWTPDAVAHELEEGQRRGYDVPSVANYPWLQVKVPSNPLPPDRYPALGQGEVAAISLTLEYPGRIVLLDDAAARRAAENAGCVVWGTLRVVLEAKSQGIIPAVAPTVEALRRSGMWISDAVVQRILSLAQE